MKSTTFLTILLLCSVLLNAQISITEFRKLEEKVNGLVTENQNLRTEVANLKSSLSQLKQTISSQNSSIDKLKELIQQVKTFVNQKIGSIEQSVATAIEDAKEESEKALGKLNNVLPVGSIVAYHLDITKIPSNWALCDGKPVTDHSSIYYNFKTPNLSGYFIRGKTSFESIGDKGGSDTEPAHTHSIPSHKHEVGSHSHYFTTNQASISANKSCATSTSGLACTANNPNEQFFLAASYQSTFETATAHSHSGTTGNASTGYTGKGGSGITGASGGGNNIPEYKAFHYIIKIK